jgi:hypothetical protein
MSALQESTVIAFSGAVATMAAGAIGWTVAYFLGVWREDRTKRLEIGLDHASTQMKEFYAPLVALTDQLNTTANIKDVVISGKTDAEAHSLSGAFYEQFFLPLHEEINTILKSKVHLLEGRVVPRSFEEYFRHYATEKAYWHLTKSGEDVSNVQVPGYPPTFYHDVRSGYAEVTARYEDALQELRERRWFFGST